MKVLTGGKFNRIHPGHVWLLKRAKKLGNLVVVLAHDRNNKREYAVKASARKKNLEQLYIADDIVVGSPTSFVAVVKKHRPDIIVLGHDQSLPKGTEKYIREKNIKVVRFGKHGTHSTRKLMEL
jgi:FAD synthetase